MATPRSRPTTTPNLTPPSEVQEIAGTLEQAGHETWCVGGAVRDALLGLAHLDWDLATAATPAQVKRAFKRTVPVGEAFGTIGVLDRRGRMHEVTTFRRDVQTDGRHAVVEFGASLDDDLARRDFTINAIAYSPLRRVLHDPYGGREDLAHGVVRAVGDPRARMVEDRLRALRALRFAGRLGFRIEPATWAAIVESAPYLPRLSRERVKQELEKTMEQVAVPSRSLRLWGSAGAMRSLIPALDAQPAWLWYAADHVAHPDATRSAGRKRRRTLLRLATMFLGLSRDVVARTLRDLRFSNRDVDWIAALAAQATALRP
ncbi:MAG TPA: CCA tRNA nucleotidyltransferase, partial [Gemmatimonadaceae bacterium]|nr:CCA tRNA nucleotidyltransferase [Gemmatimonadaceae bacterium]